MPKLLQRPRECPSITILVVHCCPDPHQSDHLQDHSHGSGSASTKRALERSLEVKIVFERNT